MCLDCVQGIVKPTLSYNVWAKQFIVLVSPRGVGDLKELWTVEELKHYHATFLTPKQAFDFIYSVQRNS